MGNAPYLTGKELGKPSSKLGRVFLRFTSL